MDRRNLHKANGQTIGKSKLTSTKARATNRAAHQDALRELEPEVEAVVAKPSRSERLKKWRSERDAQKKKEEEVKKKPFVTVVKRGVFLDTTNYSDLNKQRRKKITANKKVNAVQKPTAPPVKNVATTKRNLISVRPTSTEAVVPVTNGDCDNRRRNNAAEAVDMLAVPDIPSSELNTTFETPNSLENDGSSDRNNFDYRPMTTPADTVNMLAVPEITSELNTTFDASNSAENNETSERNILANQSFESPPETVNTLSVPDSRCGLNTTFETQQNSAESTTNADEPSVKSTPKSTLNSSLNYVSPFVTIGRGKGSGKKEVKVRESFYKLELSQSQHDSPVVRQNREATQYFRFQVNDETQKLNQTIDYWAKYKDDNDHVDSVYLDEIDVAIGQSRLLINKKFKQFLGLCDECERGVSQPAVLPNDLEGFWHMVYMQVENCNERFNKLVTLRDNDWVEIDLLPVKVVKQTKQRKVVAKKGMASSSGIQKMIEEARLKMKASQITATATAPAPSSSNNAFGPNFSMTLRQTPARLSLSTAQTPKSIIKAKTPGRRNMKSVAFSFIESPSNSKSPNKPRVTVRRASTSGIPTESQNGTTEVSSSFLTPGYRKVAKDKTPSSTARRSHRRLFSVAEK